MLTGRKYRLYPDFDQVSSLSRYAGVSRFVWNAALYQRRETGRKGCWPEYARQCAELAEAKREPDLRFLTEAPSHVLQQTLRDLDVACRRHGPWRVRFRSKTRWRPSMRFPDANQIAAERLNGKWGRVRLPKLGWMRFRMSRALGGAVRNATVSWSGTAWFVSFQVDEPTPIPKEHPKVGETTGIDRGVVNAAVTRQSRFFDRDFITPGEAARYRRLQQQLARSKKGSANRAKVLARMRATMARVKYRRRDFCARTAAELTAEYGRVALEDLKTQKMTARAREVGVAPKAGLNRAILDKGWHLLELALRSASRRTGTEVVKVSPANTSIRCFACKHVDRNSRESQAVFRCTACGHAAHADVNAAKNIDYAAGPAVSACGDFGDARSVKQEPVGNREALPHPALA